MATMNYVLTLKTLPLVATLLLCSCLSPRPYNKYGTRIDRPRAQYELQKIEQLIISNSPTQDNDSVKKIKGGGVSISTGWLIRNVSTEPVLLKSHDVLLTANAEKITLKCLVNGASQPAYTIPPQEKIILSCTTDLFPNSVNKLKTRDTTVLLAVPFGNKGSNISSEFLLRIEDFEQ